MADGSAMAVAKAAETAQGGKVWVVVVSKPGQELRAKSELMRQGFEVYLPMQLFEVASGPRKGETHAKPFFTSYLFVRVPECVTEWRAIFSTFGVSGVLGCNHSRATAVKDEVVEMIRAHEDAGFIRLGVAEAAPDLRRGESLRHSEWGLQGVFLERVDSKRALILVSFMGRDSAQTVDLLMWRPSGASDQSGKSST